MDVRPIHRYPEAPTAYVPAEGTIEQALDVLRGRPAAVLTGAGISTDSGIPDYRGPGSPPRHPMTYQQFIGDPRMRRHYWARNHVGWQHVHEQRPNAGHLALARLESAGAITGVITQNVDLLHEAAGTRNVIDLHGRYDRVVCLRCGNVISRAHLAARLDALNPGFVERVAGSVADIEIAPDADAVIEQTADFVVADCEVCGGVLKPDIVYFGETVPKERVAHAFDLLERSDALLVAGSSLAVMSGLRFARRSTKEGRPIVIINHGPTRGDALADVRVDAGTSEALTLLADALA